MELIQVGDKIGTKMAGNSPRFITGRVVEVQGKIVRFLLDAGQSEYGEIRPTFSRLINQVTKIGESL